MTNSGVNAGVRAQQGFALQRNMALFIILDNFHSKFLNTEYFLSLEHLEDILFCFLDDNGNAIKVETYQSKKKSTGNWVIGKEFAEIIVKILQVGKSLIKDQHPKSHDYSHCLFFSSNTTIHLNKKKKYKEKGVEKSKTHTNNVNEENREVSFVELEQTLQEAVVHKLNDFPSYAAESLEDELKHLKFLFIDFNRTNKEQENQLRSKLQDLFDKKIIDSKAALDSIFRLFKEVELTYNQKSIARLTDTEKQVGSNAINDAIEIITTKSKAFKFWREHKRIIAEKLGIRPFEHDIFENTFTIAFDLFKSKEEAEHQKILQFVKSNYRCCSKYNEDECIEELICKFNSKESTKLDENTLKATFYAAYFESIHKMDNEN